ncbi:hypothetical protein [Paraburkholderia sp. GAS41]|uniref:hypothetical protein n=1 Tax=Paraburkholderia sp. GAS41 TaxID=3035134 RepID=UPI003D2171CA
MAAGEQGFKRITVSVIKANLIGLLFLPVLAHLARLGPAIEAIALTMVYLLARYWGALLPSLAHFGVAPDSRAGTRTARLYFLNIVGSATGGIVTGFVLMDHLSLVNIAILLTVAGLTCAALLSASLPLSRKAKWRHVGWALGGSTDSERVQRTACLSFPYGARFTNHMSVSLEPLAWDFDNWRNTLVSYKIDGRTVLDLTSAAGRQRLEYLMSFKTGLTVPAAVRTWSPYRILRADPPRTADKLPVTDDNMGSEYRHNLGFE